MYTRQARASHHGSEFSRRCRWVNRQSQLCVMTANKGETQVLWEPLTQIRSQEAEGGVAVRVVLSSNQGSSARLEEGKRSHGDQLESCRNRWLELHIFKLPPPPSLMNENKALTGSMPKAWWAVQVVIISLLKICFHPIWSLLINFVKWQHRSKWYRGILLHTWRDHIQSSEENGNKGVFFPHASEA